MKDRKNLVCKVIFTSLSIFIISFIFLNSTLDASVSTVHSTGVREFINSIIEKLGLEFEFSENFVRKCAHFAEFFVLSVSLYLMFSYYLKKYKSTFIATLSTGLVTACIDETIQLFSPGRSGQFSDVLLDFSAVFIAACMLFIVFMMFRKRSRILNE